MLQNLSRGGLGKIRHHDKPFRKLLPRKSGLVEAGLHSGQIERVAIVQHDEGARRLAEPRVRHGDDGGLPDRGMRMQHILDFLRAQVFSAPNDEVLLPAAHRDEVAMADVAKIAHVEIAVGVERFLRLRPIGISNHDLGPARHDLALDALGQDRSGNGIADPHLVIHDAAVGGGPELLVLSTQDAERHRRRLAAAENPADDTIAQHARSAIDDFRRHRRPAAREQPERGQVDPRSFQFRDQFGKERGGAHRKRGAMLLNQLDRLRRIPPVHQDQFDTRHERHFEAERVAGDVRYGRGHEHDIVAGQFPVTGDGEFLGHQGVVRVQDALGAPRGTRRIQQHLDAVGIDVANGGGTRATLLEALRIADTAFALPAHDDDLVEQRQAASQAISHLDIVEIAIAFRNEEYLRARIAQDVSHLRIAVDEDDWIANEPAHARGQVDRRGFDPVGYLETDHVAGLQTIALQRGEEAPGVFDDFGEGRRSLALDDGHGPRVLPHPAQGGVSQRPIFPLAGARVPVDQPRRQARFPASEVALHCLPRSFRSRCETRH